MEALGGIYHNYREIKLTTPEFVREFRLWLTGFAMMGISSFGLAQNLGQSGEGARFYEMRDSVGLVSDNLDTLHHKEILVDSKHPFVSLLGEKEFNNELIYKKWIPFYFGEDGPELQMFLNWQKKAGRKEILMPGEDLLRNFDIFVKNGYLDSLKVMCEKQSISIKAVASLLAIESHFHLDAKSAVGASGVAQIMKGTAQSVIMNHKKDMDFSFRVDEHHDDRNDPIKAMKFMLLYLRYNAQMAHEHMNSKKYTHTIPKDFSPFSLAEIFLAVEGYHAGMGNVDDIISCKGNVCDYPELAYKAGFLKNAQYGIKMVAAYSYLVDQRPEAFY